MNKRIAKYLSALLLAAAVAVTQVPVSDVEAVSTTSDFQMDGTKLLKYTGTAEVVSIPDDIKEVAEEAFAGNDYLVKVTIGGDVEKIGYRAFAECEDLRTIEVGDSVTDIETAAFSNNPSLTHVSLGAGVRNMGSGVFAGDSLLHSVSVSESNPYLSYSDGALYDDEQTVLYAFMPDYDKEIYTLPGTVDEIKAYAFWGNPYIEYIRIDSALKNISPYAFSNCMNLKEVTIPLAVRSIEAKAFEDCVNLQSVTLPDSINMIHDTAFDGCSIVEFTATPGTYGAEYALSRKAEEVEDVEYQDVQDSQVISSDSTDDTTDVTDNHNTQTENKDVLQEQEQEQAAPAETPVSVNTVTGSYSSERLLGQSSIVAGRAVIFIDNKGTDVVSGSLGNNGALMTGNGESQTTVDLGGNETVNNLLSESAEKGKNFPKYTVVNGKIASQAYYQDENLTEYEFGEGITEVGDFAFARTNLSQITIPEGVEKIGYGAFYHCDNLAQVNIPDSVKEIEANAFANTPWLDEKLQNAAYVIVGDGILLGYNSGDSVINIPAGVKQIGAEVFKDHMGITAVNIPDSVTVIGEAAFSGCKNLKTVNGGENLIKVGDRAFQDCPLSQIIIPASMQEIGLAAYDTLGGTDTVVFKGTTLPVLTIGDESGRLSNTEARDYAFGACSRAIVPVNATVGEGTILQSGVYGLKGQVYDELGTPLLDLTEGVPKEADKGIKVIIDSEVVSSDKENIMATMPGNDGSYVLRIRDSRQASDKIASAYGELYGGSIPNGLYGFDITLYENGGQIPITKLGKQYITILMPKPAGSAEGLHVVTLDSDGQLEAVDFQIVNLEDGDYIQFTTSHFSPYGIYKAGGGIGEGVVNNGSAFINGIGVKDDTPDTGDFIHPKWVLAAGLFAASIALFFYGTGKKRRVTK
ncbi:MAG: leucine-rich repeat domain-containing protein [Lachnospiraceae bacterium]|nr:leucine-rich repeat domain-containing protein [Lachnospiraceae bacterium]